MEGTEVPPARNKRFMMGKRETISCDGANRVWRHCGMSHARTSQPIALRKRQLRVLVEAVTGHRSLVHYNVSYLNKMHCLFSHSLHE